MFSSIVSDCAQDSMILLVSSLNELNSMMGRIRVNQIE